MKNLKKYLGIVGLSLALVTSPVRAEELKTIQYNDDCKATYSLTDKELKIKNLVCSDGTAIYDNEMDLRADKICSPDGCTNRIDDSYSEETKAINEQVFRTYDELISPNGTIYNGVIAADLAKATEDLKDVLESENFFNSQGPIDSSKWGDWD